METESGIAHDLESGLASSRDPPEDEDSSRSQTPPVLALRPPEQEWATPVFDIPWPPEEDKGILDASISSKNEQQEATTQSHVSPNSTLCSICLDEMGTHDCTEITNCRHSFCRSCLVQHCEMSLRQYPVPCPHQLNGCRHNRIPTRQLKELLSKNQFDEHLMHYWVTKSLQQQQQQQQQVNSAVKYDFFQCPVCHTLLQGKTITTDFTCGNCRATSCRVHGREHAGMFCVEYKNTDRARSWQQTEQVLEAWTKPCSHCGMSLQKAAGCDHVVCPACHQDMCWRCGTHEYLTGKIIRHCGKCNRDYRDHRHDRTYRFRLCLILPILLPFMLLYMVIAAILCIVTGCFACCFQCGKCLQPDTNEVEGQDARRTKFGWTHGVGATLFLLLLPLIALMEDCGLHITVVDMLFPELAGEETEIPVLSTPQSDNGESAV